jgi:hypothetical protein
MVGQYRRRDRLFAVQTTALCLTMATMSVNDMILGDVAKPEAKGHRGIAKVVGQAAMGFKEDVLHNVAGVHTRRQRGI